MDDLKAKLEQSLYYWSYWILYHLPPLVLPDSFPLVTGVKCSVIISENHQIPLMKLKNVHFLRLSLAFNFPFFCYFFL